MSTNFDDFLEQQLSDPELRREYDAQQPEHAIIQTMIDARMLRASGDLDYETCRYEKRALETALHALRKQREKETSTRQPAQTS